MRKKTAGVGTAVKEILSSIGITVQSGCRCDDIAARWNDHSVEWCHEHIDEMVDEMIRNVKGIDGPEGLLVQSIVRVTRTSLGDWTARRAIRHIILRAIRHVETETS